MINIALGAIQSLQDQSANTLADQINQALLNLNQQVIGQSGSLANEMATLRSDVNDISSGTAAVTTDRNTAAYYAGKATGADVWQCGTEQQPLECSSHVNTVLNRLYDGTLIRYQDALKNAKALGYMARLSIEQRLGIRLNDITTPIGSLDPPSTWADSVCHLTGVNYQTLSQQLPEAGSQDMQAAVDQTIAGEFADQFIGDYTQKLSDFVTFYNTTYPEQDGNDSAVLSLRESLLSAGGSCLGTSTNLVTNSSSLFMAGSSSANSSTGGWTLEPCAPGDADCMQVHALLSVAPPTLPGGVTWLVEQPQSTAGDGGVVEAGDGGEAGPPGPDDVLTQQVTLSSAGSYVLSWWDEAIDPATALPTTTVEPAYQVGIYDSGWNQLKVFGGVPSAATWGPRHQLQFAITTPDVIHVVFGASSSGGTAGSVAIANVQLELSASGVSTAYVDTNSSDQMTKFACALSPTQLQGAFTRNCDPDGTCHYDLNTPIAINTQTMTSNGLSLAGKLAVGNFNFRHIDVGVNVVGTGVLNCTDTGSPDCYGSGYVQYTLTQDGTAVGVLGFDGQYRTFDFGVAAISHGKALAAERYLTMPLGSNDQALIGQVLQTQFRGRPMDGVYHLSIYDSPALQFNQITDIQIVLNYHYWSAVAATSTTN